MLQQEIIRFCNRLQSENIKGRDRMSTDRKQKNLSANRPVPTAEEISERAYQQWVRRGCSHGFDIEDWLNAEYELQNQQDILIEDITDQ